MKPHFTNAFPDPRNAPPDGPLAAGGDLSVPRLLDAYAQGIFPWFGEGEPILWWCPDPRFVLRPEQITLPRSLRQELKKDCWEVTYDEAFEDVIRACSVARRPGQDGTWIVEDMINAYVALHETGHAHSVECWRDGELAGGLYGVSLGAAFFGESMFHRRPEASKVAFAHLAEKLTAWDFQLIDCQQPTDHLARFGATCWPRADFLNALAKAVSKGSRRGTW